MNKNSITYLQYNLPCLTFDKWVLCLEAQISDHGCSFDLNFKLVILNAEPDIRQRMGMAAIGK